jgi:hypothetical protein
VIIFGCAPLRGVVFDGCLSEPLAGPRHAADYRPNTGRLSSTGGRPVSLRLQAIAELHAKGKTQQEISDQLGVAQPTVSRVLASIQNGGAAVSDKPELAAPARGPEGEGGSRPIFNFMSTDLEIAVSEHSSSIESGRKENEIDRAG